MTIKKLLSTIVFLIFISCQSLNAQEPPVVSGNVKAPPISWEEHKKLTGVGPDLVQQILKELGVNYEMKITGNWQQVHEKAKSGKIDIIVGAVTNNERAQYLDFSIPYVIQPTVIVTEKGKEFTFNSYGDLVGKRGVSNIGESYGEEFDQFIKAELDVQYIAFERAIDLLNRGEADYLIIDLYTALIYARLLRGEDAITILEKPAAEGAFSIAISKTSPYASLMPEINEKLQKAIDDKTVSRSFYTHFDNWKKLIAERSVFYQQDSDIRAQENEEFDKTRDVAEKMRLAELMGVRDDREPGSIE